jgi:hypothetical protein
MALVYVRCSLTLLTISSLLFVISAIKVALRQI